MTSTVSYVYDNFKHIFYNNDGRVIIITTDKRIGIKYVQSLLANIK